MHKMPKEMCNGNHNSGHRALTRYPLETLRTSTGQTDSGRLSDLPRVTQRSHIHNKLPVCQGGRGHGDAKADRARASSVGRTQDRAVTSRTHARQYAMNFFNVARSTSPSTACVCVSALTCSVRTCLASICEAGGGMPAWSQVPRGRKALGSQALALLASLQPGHSEQRGLRKDVHGTAP